MSHLSVRLPEEVQRRLNEEAKLVGQNRSDLVREAVSEYLTRRERDRLIEEMKRAARALRDHPAALQESRELAEEGLEDWVENIEREERAADIDPDEKWWQ